MLPEERDDRVKQLVSAPNNKLEQILLVVVLPSVPIDAPNPEEIMEIFETGTTFGSLGNHKSMKYLVAGDVAFSRASIRLTNEADGETPLSIHEADYPASPDQPFLLIFRTARIVTAHEYSLGRVPADTRVFQHIAEC